MDQQKRRPLHLVVPAIPLRLQNPPLDLLLRALKIEFLSSVQVFTLQLPLGELRELADRKRLRFEVLGVVIPGIVRSGELIEPADDIYVVRFRERALRIQKAAAG